MDKNGKVQSAAADWDEPPLPRGEAHFSKRMHSALFPLPGKA